MQVWNVLHVARWNTGRKNDAKNRHLGTIPQLCRAISSQLRHVSTIGKKLVKQQYLLQISPQYSELRPTSGWDHFGSLGHPSCFQRLSRLGSVTARHVVVGVSQTLRRWTEGATNVRQGDHHVGHWPTFLVYGLYFYHCDRQSSCCQAVYLPSAIHVCVLRHFKDTLRPKISAFSAENEKNEKHTFGRNGKWPKPSKLVIFGAERPLHAGYS